VDGKENRRSLATEDLTASCVYASLAFSFTLYLESKAYKGTFNRRISDSFVRVIFDDDDDAGFSNKRRAVCASFYVPLPAGFTSRFCISIVLRNLG
jgi:hypothetical protein